jgi:hypothetical protein
MLGMGKPVHIFQLGASVEEMVNMAAIAVIDAQEKQKKISTVLKKALYSIGSAFINYKQSIFRQNTNQSNDSTFTRQVSRKNTNTCY